MKINIEMEKNGEVTCNIKRTDPDEGGTLPDVAAVMLSALEGCADAVIEEFGEESKPELHDYFTGIFTTFMNNLFSEEQQKFTLSDAAVIMAQDEILNKALDEGKPIEEAIYEYNAKADDYIRQMKQEC